LTRDSEHLLDQVLAPLSRVADEILVLDSGSRDRTIEIARRHGCRVETSEFKGFSRQRQKAQSLCTYDHVLFVDSDEIMSDELVAEVLVLKRAGFPADAYSIRRDWFVLGKPVHAFYPVQSPDYPIRIIDRRKVDFSTSNEVHETASGYSSIQHIEKPLTHWTCDTNEEIETKLMLYSTLAAADLRASGRRIPPRPLVLARSLVAFIKWYFGKGSWIDGRVGLRTGVFAARYTYLKYEGARAMSEPQHAALPLSAGKLHSGPKQSSGRDG
jgi:glycosyltransferase involved in cell wall biosynthesis